MALHIPLFCQNILEILYFVLYNDFVYGFSRTFLGFN